MGYLKLLWQDIFHILRWASPRPGEAPPDGGGRRDEWNIFCVFPPHHLAHTRGLSGSTFKR